MIRTLAAAAAVCLSTPAFAGTTPVLDLLPNTGAPGSTFDAVVFGQPPNTEVSLVLGLGDVGPGPCFGWLGGQCLSIVGPYRVIGTTTTDGSGFAVFNITLPPGAPAGSYGLQVISNAADTVSEAESFTVTPAATDACEADPWEDSDDTTTAFPVLPAFPFTGTLCFTDTSGAAPQPADADYYAIEMFGGEFIDAEILFSHADADLDLFILEPGVSPVDNVWGSINSVSSASGISIDDNELVSWPVATAGTHYIVVQGWEELGAPTIDGAPYTLTVNIAVP